MICILFEHPTRSVPKTPNRNLERFCAKFVFDSRETLKESSNDYGSGAPWRWHPATSPPRGVSNDCGSVVAVLAPNLGAGGAAALELPASGQHYKRNPKPSCPARNGGISNWPFLVDSSPRISALLTSALSRKCKHFGKAFRPFLCRSLRAICKEKHG